MIARNVDRWVLERAEFRYDYFKKLTPGAGAAGGTEKIYRRKVKTLELSRILIAPTGYSDDADTTRTSFSFDVGAGRTGAITSSDTYKCREDWYEKSGGPEGEYRQRQVWVYEGKLYLVSTTTITTEA